MSTRQICTKDWKMPALLLEQDAHWSSLCIYHQHNRTWYTLSKEYKRHALLNSDSADRKGKQEVVHVQYNFFSLNNNNMVP